MTSLFTPLTLPRCEVRAPCLDVTDDAVLRSGRRTRGRHTHRSGICRISARGSSAASPWRWWRPPPSTPSAQQRLRPRAVERRSGTWVSAVDPLHLRSRRGPGHTDRACRAEGIHRPPMAGPNPSVRALDDGRPEPGTVRPPPRAARTEPCRNRTHHLRIRCSGTSGVPQPDSGSSRSTAPTAISSTSSCPCNPMCAPTSTADRWITGCASPSPSPPRCGAQWPDHLPLFFRVSATDWLAGDTDDPRPGWTVDDTIALAAGLKKSGVDLIDALHGRRSTRRQDPGVSRLSGAVRQAGAEPRQTSRPRRSGSSPRPDRPRRSCREAMPTRSSWRVPLLRNPSWSSRSRPRGGVTLPFPPQYTRAFI